MNSHVIPALIRKFYEAKINNIDHVNCWGTGKPFREFLHVDDLADACIFTLEKWNPNASNSPKYNDGKNLNYLNVGPGKDQSIKSLAYEIAKLIKYEGSIKWDFNKKDGTQKKLLDVSRINSMGWHSKISIKEGLKMTIENFITNYHKNNLRL